jgi:hypothetical protein
VLGPNLELLDVGPELRFLCGIGSQVQRDQISLKKIAQKVQLQRFYVIVMYITFIEEKVANNKPGLLAGCHK